MGPHMMLPGDGAAVKGAKVQRASLRRVWVFAAPYRSDIIVFLAAICVSALLALAPPLLFRAILDRAIPQENRGLITTLAVILVFAAIADAGLAIVQRWLSSRIGEGLIYDLRVALFDKVEQMPIAFFTRTQTGALTSRLNNDVVGAQNAVTNTLGSVVSNIVVLATTLTAMIALEWRLTLLSLIVLPLFIVPAKRVGQKLGSIARQQMDINAEMNTQMNERFNVDSHATSPRVKRTLKRFGTTEMDDVCRSSSHLRKGHQVMNAICFDLRRATLMMLRRICFSCSKKFARFFSDKCFILAVRRDDHAEFLCQSQRAIQLAVVDAKCTFVCKENLE